MVYTWYVTKLLWFVSVKYDNIQKIYDLEKKRQKYSNYITNMNVAKLIENNGNKKQCHKLF